MKQITAAILAGSLLVTPAFAADPLSGSMDWSGFYAGVYAGYGSGEATATTLGSSIDIPLDGALAGVTVGVNMQDDQIVYGLEADFGWSGLTGSTECLNPFFTCTGDINWSGSVRGRLGYAFDSVLLYGTAGLAFAEGAASVDPDGATTTGFFSDALIGWTVGAGAEVALSSDISLKAEYAYTDYGTLTAEAGTIATADTTLDVATHAVKVGLNYHF